MDISLYDYLTLVKGYCSLQDQFHAALDARVPLHDAVVEGYHFVPTRKSIREQLKDWPAHIPFVTSPASWVRPRQGRINHKNQTYHFTFHEAAHTGFWQGVWRLSGESRSVVSIQETLMSGAFCSISGQTVVKTDFRELFKGDR